MPVATKPVFVINKLMRSLEGVQLRRMQDCDEPMDVNVYTGLGTDPLCC